MFSTKITRASASALRITATNSTTRSFTIMTVRLQEQDTTATATTTTTSTEAGTSATPDKTPYVTARYLKEKAENANQEPRRRFNNGDKPTGGAAGGRPFKKFNRDGNNNSNNNQRFNRNRDQDAPSRFNAPPVIPYNTQQELRFADPVDWEVTSVLESRPLYANVASGKGALPRLGMTNTGNTANTDILTTLLPGTVYAAHVQGVRSDGVMDPEVEQSLIREVTPLAVEGSEKNHCKISDVKAVEHQKFLFHLSSNYQEVLNPRNAINRFNNGGAKNVKSIGYEVGSDESTTASDVGMEKSWKRLERLGGDYSRQMDPVAALAAASAASGEAASRTKAVGVKGKEVMAAVGQLIGQNQSIGFEDKKKFLKTLEKGLAGY